MAGRAIQFIIVGELTGALVTMGKPSIERPASAAAPITRTIKGSTAFRESNKLNGRWKICGKIVPDFLKEDRIREEEKKKAKSS